jgi:hypothetical protein
MVGALPAPTLASKLLATVPVDDKGDWSFETNLNMDMGPADDGKPFMLDVNHYYTIVVTGASSTPYSFIPCGLPSSPRPS